MSSQPEESVYQSRAVYSIFIQSDDPNIQGCNVWYNQDNFPFYAVPLYRVAQSVSTMTPAPLPVDSPLSAAQFSFNPRASPQGNNQTTIFHSSLGLGTPTDPGLSAHRYSAMTSPEGAASSAPPPGPSTLLPAPRANPRRYHCPNYLPKVPEACGSQASPSTRHKCEWKDCADTKGFRSLHVLARHVSEQHIKDTLKCPDPRCQKEFKRPYMLKQHLSNHHCSTRSTTANTSINSPAMSDSCVFPPDTPL